MKRRIYFFSSVFDDFCGKSSRALRVKLISPQVFRISRACTNTRGGSYIAHGILMRNRKGITETNERGWHRNKCYGKEGCSYTIVILKYSNK